MGERWAAAVTIAAEDPPANLRAAVAEELVALWSDLAQALRRAGRSSWSIECDGLVVRIVMLSRLSGATSWEWIPESLLADGVYQGVLRSAEITFTQVDSGRQRREPCAQRAGSGDDQVAPLAASLPAGLDRAAAGLRLL
jgi:hypothetical protein